MSILYFKEVVLMVKITIVFKSGYVRTFDADTFKCTYSKQSGKLTGYNVTFPGRAPFIFLDLDSVESIWEE
jgi:hypothetical protein